MASNEDPHVVTLIPHTHIHILEEWLSDWQMRVNETKSVQVTFTNRKIDCPQMTLHGIPLPSKKEVKYLGLILDRSLAWRPQIIC
jgi:hypothetical protein